MLKGIDPLLAPDLLHVLAAMGHGDELAVVDANFPAVAVARRLVRLDGVRASRALQAILSLLPLDTFTDSPAAVNGSPHEFLLGVMGAIEHALLIGHVSYHSSPASAARSSNC